VISCPSCRILHRNSVFVCDKCGYKPGVVEGIPILAPEVSAENESFTGDLHDTLFGIEEHSPWFIWRSKLINFMIGKFSRGNLDYCEIGCGNGYVLGTVMLKFPSFKFYATEILTRGMINTKKRMPEVNMFQSDATDFPFVDHFDVVGAYDVLEHVPDDVAAMRCVHRSLKAGGAFVITVPQHMFLWSFTDDMAFHKRRYSRREMTEKLASCGFTVRYISSYAFLLMPALWFVRCVVNKKINQNDNVKKASDHLAPKGFSAFLMNTVFGLEYYINKIGVHVPFGGSLICVAIKD